MFELLGGPQDGRHIRKNPPKHEAFIGPSGACSLEPKKGYERYVQLGVCLNCDVRFDDCPDGTPKYVPAAQASQRVCALCGVKTPERTA